MRHPVWTYAYCPDLQTVCICPTCCLFNDVWNLYLNTTTALRASGTDLLFADLHIHDLVRTMLELLHYILSNHFRTSSSGATGAMEAIDAANAADDLEHCSTVIDRFSL